MVTALVTVKLVEDRVKARLFNVKVLTVIVPAPVRVAFPIVSNTLGAISVVPVRLASPLRVSLLPVRSKVPPDIIVLAAKVTVPLVLVIAPLEKVGAADKVRSLPAVIICSVALSKVTALATVRSLPKVRIKSSRLKVVILNAAVVVKVALTARDTLFGAVNVVAVVFRLPFRTRVLPVKSNVPTLATPLLLRVILPPVLVICPAVITKVLVRIKSSAAVIICSLALSKVMALVTVRSVVFRVRARSFKFKVVIEMMPAPVSVALAASCSVVGAAKAVPDNVAFPFKISVLPVQVRVPPEMIVFAAKVTIPPLLVIAPLVNVGAAVRVRLLVPVMICSLALSKVTELATVRLVLASVRARSFSVRSVALMVAALVVKVELAETDRFVGAVKFVRVVSRLPFKVSVLPVKVKNVPAAGDPFKVIFPPVLVISPAVIITVFVRVKSASWETIRSPPALKVMASATVKSLVAEPKVKIRSPRSRVLIEMALAVVNVLLAATVIAVVVSLVVNVPAMFTFAPMTSDPPLKSRVVPTGMVIVSLAVSAPSISKVPVPEVVKGWAAGTVNALVTVNTALLAKTILLSLASVKVPIEALASTSIFPATRSAPVTDTLEIVAPDPFSVKMLEAFPSTTALVVAKLP